MFSYKTPEETYKAYEKFLRKKNYKKAYHALESLLGDFPNDIDLLERMVNLCITETENYEKAKIWVHELLKYRTYWYDYIILSDIETSLFNIESAKKSYEKAQKLAQKQPGAATKEEIARILEEARYKIINCEINALRNAAHEKEDIHIREHQHEDTKEKKPEKISQPQEEKKDLSSQKKGSEKEISSKNKETSQKEPDKIYNVPVKFITPQERTLEKLKSVPFSALKDAYLFIEYTKLTIQGGFDELLCINAIQSVDHYWYQIETVKKVLKKFRGRVLLCDEVGLGKTIEAGMLVKEYLMRSMARNVLILTPPPLVSQWKEEMSVKFGIDFVSTDDPDFGKNLETFWKEKYIIASIHTAKSKRHAPLIADEHYDIVVVDEAHHVRNKRTLAWKLVNQIQKKFIFLLTATPVQNNLIELYNLITLLKPGQFKTEKIFRQEYVTKGNLRKPANKDKLRSLLSDCMIRNTRSAIDVQLPKRFATTIRLDPDDSEKEIYIWLNQYLKKQNFNKNLINLYLREAGSSPFALKETLLKVKDQKPVKPILERFNSLDTIAKGKALVEILQKNPEEKKLIFTQFMKSMDYITSILVRERITFARFDGTMSTGEKNKAIEEFKQDVPVLVSTESGGEGRNLQFCNTIINFDLPWNPMRIEQRIGRLHRIGQTRDVFIFNLAVKDTIEDYLINILDSKINMFEMVIGEIEPILGHIGREDEFEDIIMDIWLKSTTHEDMKDEFEQLGQEMVKAKKSYLKAKKLDEDIFGEDYEI
jgi:SNF2 family DNA or RNA helicase